MTGTIDTRHEGIFSHYYLVYFNAMISDSVVLSVMKLILNVFYFKGCYRVSDVGVHTF